MSVILLPTGKNNRDAFQRRVLDAWWEFQGLDSVEKSHQLMALSCTQLVLEGITRQEWIDCALILFDEIHPKVHR